MIPSDLLQQGGHGRESRCPAGEKRQHNVGEETRLAHGDARLVPVHERRDGVPLGLLHVALAEHLLLKKRDPFTVYAFGTGLVPEISTLHSHLR